MTNPTHMCRMVENTIHSRSLLDTLHNLPVFKFVGVSMNSCTCGVTMMLSFTVGIICWCGSRDRSCEPTIVGELSLLDFDFCDKICIWIRWKNNIRNYFIANSLLQENLSKRLETFAINCYDESFSLRLSSNLYILKMKCKHWTSFFYITW